MQSTFSVALPLPLALPLNLHLLSLSVVFIHTAIWLHLYLWVFILSSGPPTSFGPSRVSLCVCELHELLISQLKKYDSGWWLVNILQRPQARAARGTRSLNDASWPRCLLVICRRQHIAFLSFKRFMSQEANSPQLHCRKKRILIGVAS